MELHHDQIIAKQRVWLFAAKFVYIVSLFPSRLIFPPMTSRRSPFLLFPPFLFFYFFFSSAVFRIALGRIFSCSSFFFQPRKTIDHECGHASENCSQLTARATTSGRVFFFLGQLETRVPRKLVPNEQLTKSLGFFGIKERKIFRWLLTSIEFATN